jgi:hypothetical protein
VAPDRPDQAAQQGPDLPAVRPLGRAQQRRDEAALAVEHDDRLEAVAVVVGVEQAQLLPAVHGVEGVVDVEHDAPGHVAERGAVEVDHGPAHAQQGAPVRQVLQAGDGRLRAQVARRGQPLQGQLEQRVGAQAGGVVAVLIAGRDHQQAEADDIGRGVNRPPGVARVVDAGRQQVGDPQAAFELPQDQQAAVGG